MDCGYRTFLLGQNAVDDLREKAAKAGVSQAAYLRHIITGSVLSEAPDERFYECMDRVSGISDKLRTLIGKLDEQGEPVADELRGEIPKWNRFRADIEREYLAPKKKAEQ